MMRNPACSGQHSQSSGVTEQNSLSPQAVPVAESGLFSGLEIFVQIRVPENRIESGDSTRFPERGPGQKDPDMRVKHFQKQELRFKKSTTAHLPEERQAHPRKKNPVTGQPGPVFAVMGIPITGNQANWHWLKQKSNRQEPEPSPGPQKRSRWISHG